MADDAAILSELIGSPAAAGALIERFGDLSTIVATDRARLRAVLQDLSAEAFDRVARKIEAIRESSLSLRWRELRDSGDVIGSWDAVVEYLGVALSARSTESFHVLYLDRGNRLICHDRQDYGTVDHVACYPREIIRRAIELSASALVLAHNHPSGSLDPSPADIELTRDVSRAAQLLGITVHDHLLIGCRGQCRSLRELGLINAHEGSPRAVARGQ
jgi:DNA repair protein RadC